MNHPRHPYSESCPGCQLALMNPETGERLSDDHPVMKLALPVWNAGSLEERSACNRVWVHGSRAPEDLRLMGELCERIQQAMRD